MHQRNLEACSSRAVIEQHALFSTLTNRLESVTDYLASTHGIGWFDGGCYTFAAAICEYYTGASPYYISRCTSLRDHAVVYIASMDRFLDADGLQSREVLFHKMRTVELVPVSILLPFDDLYRFPIYDDVKVRLQHALAV